MDLNYEVKIYLRHPKTFRGPTELFKIHPSGKSPILEVQFADGSKGLKLAETGLIIQFLLKYYDPQHFLHPKSPREQIKVDYYLHYAEGSLQHVLMTLLINSVAKKIAPLGLKTAVNFLTKALNKGYHIHEFKLNMKFLDDQLRKNGTGFFVGDGLTGADIILTFPIYENIYDNLEQVRTILNDKIDMVKEFPHLAKWSEMIANNESYQKVAQYLEDLVDQYVQEHALKK